MAPPPTTDVLVVFGVVLVAVALFVTERIPPDITALGVVVALVGLRPWTGITPDDAISGFSNAATVTILAMYILSAGVQETGAIQRLGAKVAQFTRGDGQRLLGATVGLTGTLAGFINNTPVVAMFIPMVTDLADESHLSPSKLLIPLSYASMLGGVLTLIGTATNILASDVAAGLGVPNTPFSMFQFTPLGVLVLVVGIAYLLTVGQWLLPERIYPVDLTAEFDLDDYLWRVYVRRNSPLVGQTVVEALPRIDADVDVIQIVRGDETFVAPASDREIQPQDVLTVRGSDDAVAAFVGLASLRRLPRADVTEDELADPERRGTLVEVVVPSDSPLIDRTIGEARLRERFSTTVLAVRRGTDVVHEDLANVTLNDGDGLLLHTTKAMVEVLDEDPEFTVTETAGQEDPFEAARSVPFFETDAPVAIAIVAGVILLAALNVFPIVIAALAGVVAMVLTDVLKPAQAYQSVDWEVIFLLAGVIPLGLALQNSGGAEYLALLLVENAAVLPTLVVLGLFYLLTGLLANVITPVASVVLMIPVAVDAAARIGASEFAFVLGVTFAASTAFMTPIGYQTNLMVYSPGGYHFTDYVRVGGPLQLLLAMVTPLAIGLLWGV